MKHGKWINMWTLAVFVDDFDVSLHYKARLHRCQCGVQCSLHKNAVHWNRGSAVQRPLHWGGRQESTVAGVWSPLLSSLLSPAPLSSHHPNLINLWSTDPGLSFFTIWSSSWKSCKTRVCEICPQTLLQFFSPQMAQLCYMGLAWLPYRDYRFSHILQFSTPAPLNPKLNPAMLNPWIPSCSIAAQFSAAGPTLVFQRHLKNVLLLSKISRPCSVSESGSKWKDFWWAKSHHQKSPSWTVHLDISLKILKKSTPLCFLMDPATNSLSNWIFMQSSDMI